MLQWRFAPPADEATEIVSIFSAGANVSKPICSKGTRMSDLTYPDDRLYHKEHLWAKKEADGTVRIGISDFAQQQLDNVIFIDLPSEGDVFKQGESGANLESVKASSDAIMPMSGKVVTVNEMLKDKPELVNSDPYGEGWLMRISPDNPDEGNLLSAAEYAALVG